MGPDKRADISLLEVKSSAYLEKLLRDNGFTIASEGTAGVPAAFVAECGRGSPELVGHALFKWWLETAPEKAPGWRGAGLPVPLPVNELLLD